MHVLDISQIEEERGLLQRAWAIVDGQRARLRTRRREVLEQREQWKKEERQRREASGRASAAADGPDPQSSTRAPGQTLEQGPGRTAAVGSATPPTVLRAMRESLEAESRAVNEEVARLRRVVQWIEQREAKVTQAERAFLAAGVARLGHADQAAVRASTTRTFPSAKTELATSNPAGRAAQPPTSAHGDSANLAAPPSALSVTAFEVSELSLDSPVHTPAPGGHVQARSKEEPSQVDHPSRSPADTVVTPATLARDRGASSSASAGDDADDQEEEQDMALDDDSRAGRADVAVRLQLHQQHAAAPNPSKAQPEATTAEDTMVATLRQLRQELEADATVRAYEFARVAANCLPLLE